LNLDLVLEQAKEADYGPNTSGNKEREINESEIHECLNLAAVASVVHFEICGAHRFTNTFMKVRTVFTRKTLVLCFNCTSQTTVCFAIDTVDLISLKNGSKRTIRVTLTV
jgi:hypothetical protein